MTSYFPLILTKLFYVPLDTLCFPLISMVQAVNYSTNGNRSRDLDRIPHSGLDTPYSPVVGLSGISHSFFK